MKWGHEMYQIDSQSRIPVYEQITEQTERYILTGIFRSGDQLQSVRSLSLKLRLNPNTVQRAYTELDRKGLIYTITGVGSYISEDSLDILKGEKRKKLLKLIPQLKELALSGIQKFEMMELIESVYKEENP